MAPMLFRRLFAVLRGANRAIENAFGVAISTQAVSAEHLESAVVGPRQITQSTRPRRNTRRARFSGRLPAKIAAWLGLDLAEREM